MRLAWYSPQVSTASDLAWSMACTMLSSLTLVTAMKAERRATLMATIPFKRSASLADGWGFSKGFPPAFHATTSRPPCDTLPRMLALSARRRRRSWLLGAVLLALGSGGCLDAIEDIPGNFQTCHHVDVDLVNSMQTTYPVQIA